MTWRIEWIVETIDAGPVVGSAETETKGEAHAALTGSVRAALGSKWTVLHMQGFRRLEALMRDVETREALRVPGISVVLTRKD